MPEKVVRKTTAKKVVRRTVSKTVPARSRVSKTVVDSPRKAPTRVSLSIDAKLVKRKSPKTLVIGIVLFLMVVGVSAAIGFSDKGQLNVESAISARKQSATGAEQEALKSVPTEQTKNALPNGGLVGTGQSEPVPTPAPTPEVVATSSVASTSDDIASSTVKTPEASTDTSDSAQ